MTGFLGEYEVTLDPKGRFLLPAGLKKQLSEEDGSVFVVNRGMERCLTLHPMSSWRPIFERISQLNDFDPEVRSFRRFFLNGATTVELDSAGRMLIPKNLMEYAGLERDIVLVSAVNKVEIWSAPAYQQLFDAQSPADFSALAARVMAPQGG
jgi:MraZ protein